MPETEGLNYSQIAEYLRCRYRWDLGANRGVLLRIPERTLSLGSAVHGALEVWTHTGDQEAVDEWLVSFGEEMADAMSWSIDPDHQLGAENRMVIEEQVLTPAREITKRAVAFMDPNQWQTVTDRSGVPLVEYTLHIPLRGWGVFHGTVDRVARDLETGEVWLIDYKTTKAIQPSTVEETNLQMAIYQYLLLRYGIKTVGSIRYQIRNVVPRKPSRNKDGSMSRSDIATDWTTYRAALVEAGLDPDAYQDMQARLEAKRFFDLTKAYRSVREVRNVWRNIVLPVAADMHRRRRLVRSLGSLSCRSCWAFDFCLAELREHDTEGLLKARYRLSTDLTPEEQAEWAQEQDRRLKEEEEAHASA